MSCAFNCERVHSNKTTPQSDRLEVKVRFKICSFWVNEYRLWAFIHRGLKRYIGQINKSFAFLEAGFGPNSLYTKQLYNDFTVLSIGKTQGKVVFSLSQTDE